MKNFRFPHIVKRKLFSIIFGGVGKRRLITDYKFKPKTLKRKFAIQRLRRSKQGWRNIIYGNISALKLRLAFGRRKPVPKFRR
jgi:hypothetical protein